MMEKLPAGASGQSTALFDVVHSVVDAAIGNSLEVGEDQVPADDASLDGELVPDDRGTYR